MPQAPSPGQQNQGDFPRQLCSADPRTNWTDDLIWFRLKTSHSYSCQVCHSHAVDTVDDVDDRIKKYDNENAVVL